MCILKMGRGGQWKMINGLEMRQLEPSPALVLPRICHVDTRQYVVKCFLE